MHERIIILKEVLANIEPFETKEQITHEIHSMLAEAMEELEQQGHDKICNFCKFAEETNVCYDNGNYFKPYLYCFKLDDLVAEDNSCDKWKSYIKTIEI